MKVSDLATLNTPEGRLRVISAAVLAPMVLAVVYLGGASFAGLIALVTATGLFEWLRLVDPEAPKPESYGMYACLLLAALMAATGMASLGMVVVVMAGVIFYVIRSNVDAQKAFWFALGLPYMAGSAVALIYLRGTPGTGLALAVLLLASVWGMDIGAYVAGRLIGGPKLAPTISPNKTWSGFIGGNLLALVLAAVVLLATGSQHFLRGLLVTLLLASVAQAGDLFKSFFKRRAGVKDCGTLIPGHGGVLDRIDGLVFAALLLAFLQSLFGLRMIW